MKHLYDTEETMGRQLEESAQKERIVNYWTERSESFAEQRAAELQSILHERWMKLIRKELGNDWKADLRILDVGTGSGFFAILLAKEGCQVTGIDLTESMIRHAKKLALANGCDADFQVMDAEKLEFPDESFDVVISRNLTWTLPEPECAYGEWLRVLKPGGLLLNYDADYGQACFTQPEEELPPEHAHHKVGKNLMEECQSIKDSLSISKMLRPAWDEKVLRRLGCREITVRTDISGYLYQERDEFFNPVEMFSLKAVKS